MDYVRLARPVLLLLLVPAWAVLWYAAMRRPRRPGAGVRAALGCAAAGLLVLALAGPALRLTRTGPCPVVILQDASPSMAIAEAGTDPARTLAPWTAALPLRQTQVVPFADGAETNLAAALRRAAAALPQGQGLVLLYTDARETTGHAAHQAARLAGAGIPVHAIGPDLAVRDAAVAGLETTPSPSPDRPVHLTVRLTSTFRGEVRLRLSRAAADALPARTWNRAVPVSAGAGAVAQFRDGPLPAGRYRYDVVLEGEADACPDNNRARCTVTIGGLRDVCYVHARPEPGPLADVLRRTAPTGVRLTVRPVSAGPPPTDAAVVVLENVPAWVLGRRQAERLGRAVTDAGLGLWVLGGDAAFAAGAYGNSPLEPILPVSSRLADRPAIHLVLVLDASGSMNETVEGTQKLTLAKRAVLTLRPALAAGDRIGVVAFAGRPTVVAPMGPIDAWDALRARLLALDAGGGTRITPAVLAALEPFSAPTPPGDDVVRHVLILSDGRSEDFTVDRLAADARSRRVSLSAVATGDGARVDLLGRLASGTGGRLYADADLPRLADTFLKDMARARGEGLRQVRRTVRWVRGEPVWRTTGPPLPGVPAYNVTRARDGADLHWVTGSNGAEQDASPLLATWRRGLGKVAAMPWPAGVAPDAWLRGPAAGERFAPLLAWLAGAPEPRSWSARVVRRGAGWIVRVRETAEALGETPAPFVAVAMTETAAPPATVTLEQVEPGIHEASVGDLGAGGGTVVVHCGVGRPRCRLAVPVGPPAELVHLGVDRDRLSEIVRAGGGRVHTTPRSFVEAVRQIQWRAYQPVDRLLVWAAGAVVGLLAVLRILGRA